MLKRKLKSKFGIFTAFLLIFSMILSMMPVFAAEEESAWDALQNYSVMKTNVPDNFETTDNPTGTDSDTPLLVCTENELLSFTSYNTNQNNSDSASMLTLYNRIQNQTGEFSANAEEIISENLKNTQAGIYGLNAVQGAAFDPNKTGRKDHVAFVGIDGSKNAQLVIYDAINHKWSEKTLLGSMSWMSNSTNAYQMQGHLSITAGDYDGDYHDTVVVFASLFNTDRNIFEYSVTSSQGNISLSLIGDPDNAGCTLLHPYYESRLYTKSNTSGRNQLNAQLETGDLNGDGVDDLAVLSWLNKSEKMTDNVYFFRTFSPYLYVAAGEKQAGTVIRSDNTSGQYVDSGDNKQNDGSRSTSTMYAPGMAIGKFSAGSVDTIVIAGRGIELKTKKNDDTCDSFTLRDWVNMATVSYNGGALQRPTFTTAAISSMNELTKHTTKEKDAICSSTLEAVAFDGPDAADYLFFDGDIYTLSDGNLTLVEAFATKQKGNDSKKWGDYGDITYISSSAVGNFNGEKGYYETIVFTLWEKNSSTQNDYHGRTVMIYGSEHDAATGKVSAWGCTETSPRYVDDKGDNLEQAANHIVVAVDCDEDGSLLKYHDKACYYSDPAIFTILQASPYFDSLNDNGLTETGSSGLSVSESYGKSTGEEDSHDLGVGVALYCDLDFYSSETTAGYTRNWTSGWENSLSYSYTETFSSSEEDQVVVYRTPVFVYTYEIWDPETHSFLYDDDHLLFSYVAQKPVYTQMGLEEYDDFARAYNAGMAEKTAELKAQGQDIDYEDLTVISDSDYAALLNHAGDPYGYENEGGRTLSQNTVQLGHAGGSAGFDIELSGEYTKYKSASNGFSFETEQMGGVEYLRLGGYLNYAYTSTSSDSTTQGTGVSYSAYVGNVCANDFEDLGYEKSLANEYNFNWQAKVYDTDIPGKGIALAYDNAGNAIQTEYVQIIGFKTDSVTSPPAPPEVETTATYNTTTKSFTLNWGKSEDASGGYRILRLTDPRTYTYVVVDTVGKNTTDYQFRNLESGVSNYVFAVQSLDKNGNDGLRSNNIFAHLDEAVAETDGQNFYQGHGLPSENLGKIADYYKDMETDNLYRKNSTGWTFIGNKNDYDLSSTGQIETKGINIEVYCSSKVSEADRSLIESQIGKFEIENINEDVREQAMENVLKVVFADYGCTQQDIEFFLKNPDNQIELSSDIEVIVKKAAITGVDAPYIEYAINAAANVHLISESLDIDNTVSYELKPADFASDADIELSIPLCGDYEVENVVHHSDDGQEIYHVYTEDGEKTFTYNQNKNTIKVSVNHFSNIRINGKAGSNKTNVNTGIIDKTQTQLVFAIGLLILAGIACFVLAKRKEKKA